MSEEREPYEVFPEGPEHATAEWIISLMASAVLIIGLIALAWPRESKADEGWCEQWQNGYEASFYLVCRQCQDIEPKQCPEPEQAETDGYMRGVKDGAADGKKAQKEWI